MNPHLDPMPDDWDRALAVVAHPDDLEYGAASAVARWTRAGKTVAYVIVTDGEAGIDGIAPGDAAVLRQKEQLASAAIVGVSDVTFLHHPDGVVRYGPELRRDIARHVRRTRPDIVLSTTSELTFRMGGRRLLNQADHRTVGVAALDAARDAGNRWIFPELLDDGLDAWAGTADAYLFGSGSPSHGVDVGDGLAAGVESLRAHRAYLDGLGRDFDPDQFLRHVTAAAGERLGVPHAVAFERIGLHGI
ncbi:PIG-L family deacetylase [Pseudonocardia sp. C8]|uniref:PIG-L deacetylase family protein n=1 Tax=Pseudonocardia sp. C8 TaxID=2762759 RepID=UPI001642F695|nr:PIG-L deacetylase family protein [Pseudonocardia sp. C8]MBC3191016.1 PIG-L family deacetylase [Pseudonocardia sp. C8]